MRRIGQVSGPWNLLAINPDRMKPGLISSQNVISGMVTDVHDFFGCSLETFGEMPINQRIGFGNLQLAGADRVFD